MDRTTYYRNVTKHERTQPRPERPQQTFEETSSGSDSGSEREEE